MVQPTESTDRTGPSDVDKVIFEQVASLGEMFGSPDGVTVVPATLDGKEVYVLADIDSSEETTFVFAVLADEDLLSRLQHRDGNAVTISRKRGAE